MNEDLDIKKMNEYLSSEEMNDDLENREVFDLNEIFGLNAKKRLLLEEKIEKELDLLLSKAYNTGKLSFEEEKKIAQSAYHSNDYAIDVLKSKFPLGEKAISKDAHCSFFYALEVLDSRFELGEKKISKNSKFAYKYAKDILKGRFELGENTISKSKKYKEKYCKYFNISERDLKINKKDIINKFYKKMTPEDLCNKAVHGGKLSLEEEKTISHNAKFSYKYAKDILKGRFELGEKAISKNAEFSCYYAVDILKSRFPQGENKISQHEHYKEPYCNHFNISEKDLIVTKKDMINKYYKK